MPTPYLFFAALLGAAAFFAGCEPSAHDKTIKTIEKMDMSRGQESVTRTDGREATINNATSLQNALEAFVKFPSEQFHALGFRTLTKKLKQELADKGNAVPFVLDATNHVLQLRESFQQEDDDAEERDIADFAVFTQKGKPQIMLFVRESSISRLNTDQPKLRAQHFWFYDGKNWQDASARIPLPQPQHFYELAAKEELSPTNAKFSPNVELMPLADSPDLIQVRLHSSNYDKNKVELYRLQLRWNGETFLLQQQNALETTASLN
jgi:hypothetical protein